MIWLIVFLFFPDKRKDSIKFGLFIGGMGLFLEYFFYTKDWWIPQTITHTTLGIEDFIFGFSIGGSAITLSNVEKLKASSSIPSYLLYKMVLLSICAGNIAFFAFHFSSFLSFIISSIPILIAIVFFIPQIIKDALITGFLLMFFAVIGFQIMDGIEPGFVEKWWFPAYAKQTFLKIPIADLVWFFISGILIKGMYAIWKVPQLSTEAKLNFIQEEHKSVNR